MNIVATPIAGVVNVATSVHRDHRGEFARLFCERELESCLRGRRIVQVNRSMTQARGTVRGMHYQRPPSAEMKLVRCLKGRVWDVAIDLRAGSPTFKRWHAEELSAANARMLIIPEGCAHGFQVLEEGSELLYLHTAFYDNAAEGGLSPTDPAIGITWPLPVTGLSARDQSHPALTAEFGGIEI